MNHKNILKIFCKIVISTILIIILCSRIDINLFAGEISKINIGVFAFSLFCYLGSLLLGAIKWQLLLKNVSLVCLLKIMFTSQFYATVLPGQLFGEASKVVSLHKENKTDEEITASVIIDKVIGLIAVIVLGMIGIVFTEIDQIKKYRIFFIVIFIVLMSILLLPKLGIVAQGILYFSGKLQKAKSKQIQKLALIFLKFYDAWNAYVKNIKILVIAIFLGLFVQLMGIFQEYGIGESLGVQVSIYEYFWIYAALSFLLLLPISFAGLGVREISLVGFLGIFGVSKESAITLSAVMLSSQLIGAMMGGIIILCELVKDIIRGDYK